tara:strand:- start:347 stop:508 length:162 start_codon:yes stop_codon:yes gene_type:complete
MKNIKNAIKTLEQTIENIEKEMNVTITDDEYNYMKKAKNEAIKCLSSLRYINQ